MPNLLLTAEPGLLGAEPGNLEPGGPGAPRPAPFLPAGQTYPYIAHLFTQGGAFKKLLGKLTNYPTLSAQQNGGQAAIQLELPAQDTATNRAVQGDIIKLTQQGGDSAVLYTGIIEDLPDNLDITILHAIDLVPLAVELDGTPVTLHYTTATDVAQMVRAAVEATDHLFVTPQSCPDAKVTGIADFTQVNALQVLDTARKIGGVNFYFFVDPIGCVWFGQVNMAAPATYTIKRGVDYQSRKYKSPIAKLKNHIPVNGGIAANTSGPMFSLYHNATSIAQYGTRALYPAPTYENIDDQATLDAIRDTLGAGLDRQITRVELDLNNYSTRIDIKAGATLRYWEPNQNTQPESTTGTGTYSPTYVVLETHVTGPNQQIVVSDCVASGLDDFKYEIDRIMARTSIANLTYVPASLNVMGAVNGGGIATPGAAGTARWIIDGTSIRGEDGTSPSPRAELGNLPANGISAAGWKFRASDVTGTPVWDSDGLIGVMQVLATASPTGTFPASTAMGTWGTYGSGAASFSVSRPVKILVLCTLALNVVGTPPASLSLGLATDQTVAFDSDADAGSQCNFTVAYSPGAWVNATLFMVRTVAAGSHTINLMAGTTVNASCSTSFGLMRVFQLGA